MSLSVKPVEKCKLHYWRMRISNQGEYPNVTTYFDFLYRWQKTFGDYGKKVLPLNPNLVGHVIHRIMEKYDVEKMKDGEWRDISVFEDPSSERVGVMVLHPGDNFSRKFGRMFATDDFYYPNSIKEKVNTYFKIEALAKRRLKRDQHEMIVSVHYHDGHSETINKRDEVIISGMNKMMVYAINSTTGNVRMFSDNGDTYKCMVIKIAKKKNT